MKVLVMSADGVTCCLMIPAAQGMLRLWQNSTDTLTVSSRTTPQSSTSLRSRFKSLFCLSFKLCVITLTSGGLPSRY